MDLPKQIDQWDSRGMEADRYEFFQPAGAYVLFLRPRTTGGNPENTKGSNRQ
jgi:hypothetical protein